MRRKTIIPIVLSLVLIALLSGRISAYAVDNSATAGSSVYQEFLNRTGQCTLQIPEAKDTYVTAFVKMPNSSDVSAGMDKLFLYNNMKVEISVNNASPRETRCIIDDTASGDRFAFTTSDKLGNLTKGTSIKATFTIMSDEGRILATKTTQPFAVGDASTNPNYSKRSLSLTVTPKTKTYTYNKGVQNKSAVDIVAKYNGKIIPTQALSYDLSYAHTEAAGTAKVTVTMNGDYTGTGTAEYTVKPREIVITKITPKTKVYTYNAKYRKPGVKLEAKYKDTGKSVPAAILEDVTHNVRLDYSKCRNVGTATVTATMKNNYTSNSKSASYKINPKGTTVTRIVAKKNGFTVKWNAQKLKMKTFYISGYQIQYNTNKNFKSGNKTLTVGTKENKDYKLTSKTVNKLKGGKKYYVRVRTYKKLNGKKYYSSWSKAKEITTKK